jgi:hypothetical protein
MRNSIKFTSLFLISAFFSIANAQSPPSGPDMRCLLVGMRFATTPDSQQKSAGLMLISYFYAKLDQTPPKELEDALAKEALDMSPTDFRFEARRCGEIIKDMAQAMKNLGANLAHRRQETADKQEPSATPTPTPASSDKTSSEK